MAVKLDVSFKIFSTSIFNPSIVKSAAVIFSNNAFLISSFMKYYSLVKLFSIGEEVEF